MTDISSTLASIDAATGCQQCEGPLGNSPSPDFCSQDCQTTYFAARTDPLVGYREPVDLAAHIHNQVEVESPETTVRSLVWPELRALYEYMRSPGHIPAAFTQDEPSRTPEPLAHFHLAADGTVTNLVHVQDEAALYLRGHGGTWQNIGHVDRASHASARSMPAATATPVPAQPLALPAALIHGGRDDPHRE